MIRSKRLLQNYPPLIRSTPVRLLVSKVNTRLKFKFPLGLFDQFWPRPLNVFTFVQDLSKILIQNNLRTTARVFIASVWIFVFLAISQRWTILDLTFTLISQKSALRSSTIMLLIFIFAHDTWCHSTKRCTKASHGDSNLHI